MNERASVAAQERPVPADSAGSADECWRSALDDLEALVEHQRLVLDAGGPADPAALAGLFFTPPDDLPPLPRSMEDRARRLLADTRALAEQAREMSDAMRPAGRGVHQSAARRPTATVDLRA